MAAIAALAVRIVQNGDATTVLRPGFFIGLGDFRALLAIGNRLQAVGRNAGAHQEALDGRRTTLTERAATLITEALGLECAAFFATGADDERLLLLAGAGWRSGTVGRVDAGARTFMRHVLEAGDEPVIVQDLAHERRFSVPRLLRDRGLVSGVAIAVATSDCRFGVLGAFGSCPTMPSISHSRTTS